jgi:cytidylate kinase
MSLDASLHQMAHSARLHVSIDGPAGSGKSTVGRGLAFALHCPYLDTGLMYRAVTWLALQRAVPPDNAVGLVGVARSVRFDLGGPGESLLVDGAAPSPDLRSTGVDAAVSTVSAHPAVRGELVQRQRELARDRCVVMVGRDIGTVVLPNADVKLWVTASAHERARRRLAERLPGATRLTLAEAEEQMMERDAQDAERKASPLKRPEGAIDIDTELLTPEECVQLALQLVRRAAFEELRSKGARHG